MSPARLVIICLKMLWIFSRGIAGQALRAFPGSCRNFFKKVPGVLGVWPTSVGCTPKRSYDNRPDSKKKGSENQGPLNGGVSNGGGGVPDLDLSFLFCPLLSCLGLRCFAQRNPEGVLRRGLPGGVQNTPSESTTLRRAPYSGDKKSCRAMGRTTFGDCDSPGWKPETLGFQKWPPPLQPPEPPPPSLWQ